MADDRDDGRRTDARMFWLGRIVVDRDGEVDRLKQYAGEELRRPLERLRGTALERAKYSLWDSLDTLEDASDRSTPDVSVLTSVSLLLLVETYARFLGVEAPPASRLHAWLTDGDFRRRYALEPLPDGDFASLVIAMLEDDGRDRRVELIRTMTRHVHDAMGGFDIDGWTLRSDVEMT